jgi:subtilisin family serine protease
MKGLLTAILTISLLTGCGGSSNNSEDPIEQPEDPVIEEPYFKYQWEIHPITTLYYVEEGSDSKIDKAWEKSTGEDVIIAIIDSGFDNYHEDIINNVIDTYNVADDSSDVSVGQNEEPHGTAVFGIVGAQKNGLGLIGVAHNSKFILIKMDNTQLGIVKAFQYAKDHGAKIISNSWGTGDISDITRDTLQDMYNSNITVIFACGNEGRSLDEEGVNDECEEPTVIGVGSSNEKNERSSYSNYGSNMDILAPSGEYGIVTTDEQGEEGYNIDNLYTLKNNNYTYFAGTSASTPIIAGITALIYSLDPTLTPDEVRNILINSTEKIGNVEYDSNGWNDYYSYGKIDAEKAVNIEALK